MPDANAKCRCVRLPGELQAQLEQLQQSIGPELKQRENEAARLEQEHHKLLLQLAEVTEYAHSLQQQKDLVDSELVHVKLDLKQTKERVSVLEAEVAGEPARLAQLRETLDHEVRLTSELTIENVDLKLALEAARLKPATATKEESLPRLNLPAEVEVEDPALDLFTLAYRDLVTGLPNFHSGLQSLSQDLEKASQGQLTLAVAVLDIEQLRDLNIYLGHEVTDQILGLIPPLVKPLLQDGDRLLRGRDDEFWLILSSPTRGPLGLKTASEYASNLLKQIYSKLQAPLEWEEHKVSLALASGVFCSQGDETAEAVLDKALLAVAAAKKAGRNRASHYILEMEKPIRARLALIPELRQALNRSQFELRFQPIWDLSSQQMRAVESLLRWEHPLEGLREPSQFLDAAYASGLIVAIGEWVTFNVCHLSKAYRHLQWTINLSAQELIQADFAERLSKAIESAKLSRADRLILEVSETHMIGDSERLAAALKGLRHLKVGLAIDDFSFDSVSLRRLQSLGAHYVKLGPQITQSVTEPLYRSLIQGAVLASESLGIKVIAEGIESQTQLDQLSELGCHWGQGYFLSAPCSLDELDEKLKSRVRL